MQHTTVRFLLGLTLLATLTAGSAVAAQARFPEAPSTPDPIRVSIDASDGFATRLVCLTPSKYGTALVPPAKVPRRTCLSEREWAARHVVFADE